MRQKTALILVDLQNDFCEGGSLAVPQAHEVISLANNLQNYFDVVIATKDWHPEEHISFASNHSSKKVGDVVQVDNLQQILWPDHCVQNSKGAEFHPQLDTTGIQKIILKGTHKNIDSYSAFFDNAHIKSTGLEFYLRSQNIRDIYIMGLATDYCVKYSCLDGAQLGFNVHVIEDACRGVELQPGDIIRAFEEMEAANVKRILSADVKKLRRLDR